MPEATAKESLEDDAKRRLPIYILIDTSWSMSAGGRIDAVREIVPAIYDATKRNPMLAHKAMFSVIEMDTHARVVVVLSSGTEMPSSLHLEASGGTNYAETFELLKVTIERDYQQLKADGIEIYRPAVLFVTDGEPICDESRRKAAFAELTAESFKRRPNIVMFGVGDDVTVSTLAHYKSKNGAAFITKSGGDAAHAIADMTQAFLASVVSSVVGVADDLVDEDDIFNFVFDPEDSDDIEMVAGADDDLFI
ncbi:hypothetical protein EEB13_10110 [Rhodococcus sp. WS3]|uniref:vWA domain-containing protein n=1 Tax=Rhodococcus sp. WS3 TaxID=2486271 RepID=UPI0011437573|nr:VWA domain-containing protein [Rhodococcus sp. WS3]ROZ50160.1 hypothetical protein EEB13_10110 [Rhodococcus sp. WS3]